MTFCERIDATHLYVTLANRLIADGENVAAGEILWGAVHNVIQAIAIQHDLLEQGKEEIRRAAAINHLVDHHGHDDSLFSGLSSAGRLHGHFYNQNSLPGTHQELIQSTQSYIDTLLGITIPANAR